MVAAVREGVSMREAARRFRVHLRTVQRWVRRAERQRLDRVEWAARSPVARRIRRTPAHLEDRVLALRRELAERSPSVGAAPPRSGPRGGRAGSRGRPRCAPSAGSWRAGAPWTGAAGCAGRRRPRAGSCPPRWPRIENVFSTFYLGNSDGATVWNQTGSPPGHIGMDTYLFNRWNASLPTGCPTCQRDRITIIFEQVPITGMEFDWEIFPINGSDIADFTFFADGELYYYRPPLPACSSPTKPTKCTGDIGHYVGFFDHPAHKLEFVDWSTAPVGIDNLRVSVPEASTLLLLGGGLAGVAATAGGAATGTRKSWRSRSHSTSLKPTVLWATSADEVGAWGKGSPA